MKILFVEDDDAIAMGLQYTLEQEGYQVTWCRTVKAALEALESEPGKGSRFRVKFYRSIV